VHVSILGVKILNYSCDEALDFIEKLLNRDDASRAIYIVNAHTLNLAEDDGRFRDVLNGAHGVFADGTGARWAARLRGVRMKDNLVGTDLLPLLFEKTAGRGYRYYLLGAEPNMIEQAAASCREQFPGWELAGYHHGHFPEHEVGRVIDGINAARPHLLLVGMGNPIQEKWLHRHRDRLRVPLGIGVGGLFDHWGGRLERAPEWVRKRGFEWFQIMLQQPHKWRRYLIGNPKFLVRVVRSLPRDRAMVSGQ